MRASLAKAFALLAAVVATAASPSGAIVVSVSYPDTVVAGTTATASESVTNNGATPLTLTLTNTLVGSNGTSYTQTQVVTLQPGETFTQSFSRLVKNSDRGSYVLTFTASDGAESATATAETVVVKR